MASKLRGLIVREPYASMIVSGIKKWEIRRFNTRIRGPVVIISHGYGLGIAELYETSGPFSPSELERFAEFHKVPAEFLRSYSAGKELYVWKFRNAYRFPEPVKLSIPKGAQVWVRVERSEILIALKKLKRVPLLDAGDCYLDLR